MKILGIVLIVIGFLLLVTIRKILLVIGIIP